MELVAIVTGLAIVEYFVFVVLCGQARGRYDVAAPSTTGDPTFERFYRSWSSSCPPSGCSPCT